MEFEAMEKIPRLKRGCVITEKIDGTNAQIFIEKVENLEDAVSEHEMFHGVMALATWAEEGTAGLVMMAGSRRKWVSPVKHDDNYGFAAWVHENATDLLTLGPGRHFGEWWGLGIQRGYGQHAKRFSLFNSSRFWHPESRPSCCDVVPVLAEGDFSTGLVDETLQKLKDGGSVAAPGFDRPEGIMLWLPQARTRFKVTLDGDGHKGDVNASNA